MSRKKAVPPAETPEPASALPAVSEEAVIPPGAPEVPPDDVASSGSQPPEEPETAAPPEAADNSPEAVIPLCDPEAPSDDAASGGSQPSVPEGRPAIVTAARGLNLRDGPGFGFEVLTVLEYGSPVLILDLPAGASVPGWELVWAGGMAGWVSSRFLRPREG